ncbi:MAG TPA: BBP7 family outer membrane beta-barrel protein [Vicinamibacterales bacterium]|nr:BBP7 family outer membrane beta-barrel protein [Vicinamibacterales bacterium]
MRRAAFMALIASTATGGALAQSATAPTTSDSRWSVSAEAIFAWLKKSPTPVPIITDSYADAPGVKVFLGGGSVDTNPNAGLKLTGTYRIADRLGVELSGFYIPTRRTTGSVSSTGEQGSIDLMLPFHDVTINQENVTEISFWPEYRGSAQATLSNNFGGGEVNVTWAMPPGDDWRVDLLGGFRFLQLRESYKIATSSPYNPPNPVDVWNTSDSFDTRNRFYGVQVGARAAYDHGPWVGSAIGKVALGSMQQRVSIDGFVETNDYNDYGATQTFPGGYFALPTNSGEHSHSAFAVVSEVALNIGYRLTRQATVYLGYSFVYASNVARPGDQINRNINPTQTVSYGNDPPVTGIGPAQPTFSFRTTDFWAQSLSVGFAYSF